MNAEIWFASLPFLDRVRKAADLGYPAIEFWPWRSKDVRMAELGKLTAELKLDIAHFTGWGFEPGMNDPRSHDALVQEIGESCKVANDLACKALCVVGGNDQPGVTQAEMHANIVTALKRVAPVAERHGVTLLLEPMKIRVDQKGHCLYGSEAGVHIFRAVGSPFVKLNWDLYHCQLAYAQVADTPGRHEPGTGEVNYARVLKQLYELGYRGYVGLECWPLEAEQKAAERVYAADSWT